MRPLLAIALVVTGLTSCNRDPNVMKQVYLEKGNKWFDRGKYKEALLMYRDALQKDTRFAEAHYRIALTYLKVPGGITEAVHSLRRADEFFKLDPNYKKNPHYWDTVTRLSQIYLNLSYRDKVLMHDVETNVKLILDNDSNSFDGHNLAGELAHVRGVEAARAGNAEESKTDYEAALAEYQKAITIKPSDVGVMMDMGAVHEALGNPAEAERLYRKVMETNKTYQPVYYSLYKLAISQKNNAMAEQALEDGYRNNPKQFLFLERLAGFYYTQQRRDDMLNALQEIKKHAGENPRAYFEVGDFYYRLGEGNTAIKEYREGIEKDPKHKTDYQKGIIEVLMHENKRTEAAGLNQEILKQNPSDNDSRSLDATLKLDKGDITAALAELQQVVTQSPDNAIAHFNLGRAYSMQGGYAEARQHFNRAIELRPDYLAARIALAQLEVVHGEFEAGAKAAEAALGVDPNNLNARLVESAAMIGMKRYPDARTMLDGMLAANPNTPDILFQLAVVDMNEKKWKDAEAIYHKVYDLNPDNPRALIGLAEAYILQGKVDEAVNMLKAESDKRPARLDLKMVVADTAQRTGHYPVALEYYQKVLDSLDNGSKERVGILTRMGEVYRRKGDLEHAIEYLSKAKDLQPGSVGVLVELALTLDEAKEWTRAETVYEAALKINPNEPFSLNNLAFLEAEHGGDLNHAQGLAQRAKQYWPDRPEVSDTLGWIYLKRNLAGNAVDIFRELVRSNPHSSTFHYHLCQAFDKQGDKVSAVKQCNEALQENPAADEQKDIRDTLQRITR